MTSVEVAPTNEEKNFLGKLEFLPLKQFDITADSRHDLDTYVGRARHFFEIFNPLLLFTRPQALESAKKLLQDYQKNPKELTQELNAQLWEAKRITSAMVHPQTKETIPWPFRMSGFVPMNLPIACGMLLTSSTPAALFWQWYNQSYNVCVNYSNGNKSETLGTKEVGKSYLMAVSVACGTSYGLGKALDRAAHSVYKSTLKKIVPFTAVASAGALNCILMRSNEMKNGVDVMDQDGNIVGKSKVVGRYAVLQTAFSRVVLPAPILFFPPIILNVLYQMEIVRQYPRVRLPLNLGVITLFLWGALPCACALFPQKSSIPSCKLEKEFAKMGIETFYYNRGL